MQKQTLGKVFIASAPNLHQIWWELDHGKTQKPLFGTRSSVLPLFWVFLFGVLLFLAYGQQEVGRHTCHWQPPCNKLHKRGTEYRNQIVPRREDCGCILFYLECLYFSHTYKTNITNKCIFQQRVKCPFSSGKGIMFRFLLKETKRVCPPTVSVLAVGCSTPCCSTALWIPW